MEAASKRRVSKGCFWVVLALSLFANLIFWEENRLARQQLLDERLIAAMKAENVAGAIALLRQGASANAIDSETPPPGWIESFLIRLRLKKRSAADSGPTSAAIFVAVSKVAGRTPREPVDLIRELIKHGANPNERDEYGATPIGHAAVSDHAEVVRVLIEGGADVNARDNQGDTALSTLLSLKRQYPKSHLWDRSIEILKRAGAR